MKLRVLIADDEPLNRRRLRQFVSAEPDAEVVAECADGWEAVAGVREKSPDLALLDVRMPGLDGFGVIEALRGSPLPTIIFVTAFDHFAVRAFEADAVDFLLKPYNRERFQTAFHRARERLRPNGPVPSPSSSVQPDPTADEESVRPLLNHLAIKTEDRITIVGLEEIDWVCSADNYVELRVGRATHLLRMTLTELASQLSPNQFVRISRSHLVNLERIREIRSRSHGDYLVCLQDGSALPGTRNFRDGLTRWLGR